MSVVNGQSLCRLGDLWVTSCDDMHAAHFSLSFF